MTVRDAADPLRGVRPTVHDAADPTRRQALLAALALAGAAGCKRRSPPATVTDARRVVSLAPSTTEALFAIGAGDRVVGRSTYCDYPPESTRLPAVGGVEPDLEEVLELRPDLVVGLAGASASRAAEMFAAHGVPSWFAPDASLADIDAMIVGIGARTAHAAQAREVAARIDAQVHAVEVAVAGEPRPRVLMVVSVAPVVAAGPGSFADELLRRAGAANVLAGGEGWQAIGMERVAELDPDALVDASSGIRADAAGWGAVRAVREGHILRVRDARVLRAGPRIGEGLAVLAKLLHPAATLP
jgi:iron complex transport system substrate-binding protein